MNPGPSNTLTSLALPQCHAASAEHLTQGLPCPDCVPVPGWVVTSWPGAQRVRQQGSKGGAWHRARWVQEGQHGRRAPGKPGAAGGASPLQKNREGFSEEVLLAAGESGRDFSTRRRWGDAGSSGAKSHLLDPRMVPPLCLPKGPKDSGTGLEHTR